MKNSIISKTFLLLPLLLAGIYNAQTINVKSKGDFSVKSADVLAVYNGYDRCGTTEYEEFLRKNFPGRMTTDQFEAWIKPFIEKAKTEKSMNGNIVTIPVVVHVIHGGQAYGSAPNIVDEQVISQITVMNQDYRKLTGTPGFNSSAVGADVEIEFALAKVDPQGNPTNGIDRVKMCQSTFKRDAIEAFVKPETIWDPTQYMNMWSVAFASPNTNLLGYAQFPDGSNLQGLNPVGGIASTDGVVANFATFGSSDFDTNGTFIMGAPYDKGRTMTHEVGHFLGLRHIWGDTTCGTDYCSDTPVHQTSNGGCPTHPKSNTCGTTDEMFENYMDYTNDSCMNIFTNDQKARITAVMNNSPRRASLKTSIKNLPIPLFANDAEVKLERACGTPSCSTPQALQISVINRGTNPLTSATINYTINGNSQTYNWTGNLAQDKYQIVNLPVAANTNAGPVTVSIITANGVTDQRSSNDTVTGSYVGAPTPVDINVVFNLQLDYFGSEISWTLKNSAGAAVYSSPAGGYTDANPNMPALITQNWTLNPNECYTFNITDSYGDGFYSYGGYYNITTTSGTTLVSGSNFPSTQSRLIKAQVLAANEVPKKDVFGIYPNPVHDILNIKSVSDKATFEIHNAVGQLVRKGTIINSQVNVSDFVKGNYIITIKDHNISESIKFIKK
ncbi:Por secretion system C-terminal sorting domain-containing protein [Chryseobacterium taichungense]|uniref:Por secretion system C-terminal sorting domain-containing protein n=1 Tax=Chryseobacterium taichungense TaxID=295069 RepID=A0A1H7WDP0_9FLAO|nr:M43 family zinc metalloprotease [Chryseobacterium taichungense]SEM19047.1 Por secretion system C-terminal sorting domain-containing protein [Chryseobacterium taichungense]